MRWCVCVRVRQAKFFNEVFVLSWVTKQWRLACAESDKATGGCPARRHFHSAVAWNRHGARGPSTMVVFGGKCNGYFDDVWAFDFGTDVLRERERV